MKKLITLSLLLASISLGFSQNAETKLKADFEQIISFTKDNQMDKVMEMTYPRFVDLLPEGGMAALTTSVLDGMGIKTMYEDIPINLIESRILKLNKAEICLAQYDANSVLEFTDKSMVDMFTLFPPEGYNIEKIADNKLRMTGKGYLLAIKDEYTKNTWKYLNYSEDLEATNATANFISDEILKGAAELKKELINK